jgi:hypothetical protein
VADALSRVSYLMALSQVSEVQPLWVQEVLDSYETDMEAQELKTQLLIQSPNEQGYSLHQGIIRRNGVIWIGDNSALRTKLITTLHDSAIGGHSGVHATYHRVKKCFGRRDLRMMLLSSWGSAKYVSRLKVKECIHQDCYSLCLSLQVLGRTFLWILWRGCLSLKVLTLFW